MRKLLCDDLDSFPLKKKKIKTKTNSQYPKNFHQLSEKLKQSQTGS